MYLTSEQIHAARKANMEAILSLATTQLAAIEKFANLNAKVIKTAFEGSIANARALAGARNVQELVKLQSTFAHSAIEKAIAGSRSVHKVAVESNAERSRAAETVTAKGLARAEKGHLSAKPGKSRSGTKRRSIKKAAPRKKQKRGKPPR